MAGKHYPWWLILGASIGSAVCAHFIWDTYWTSKSSSSPTKKKPIKKTGILHKDFEIATECVSSSGRSLSNKTKLKLYGLYKQATLGACEKSEPSPFDIERHAKWSNWNNERNLSKADAMQAYIEIASFHLEEENNTEDEGGSAFSMGNSVSTLQQDDGDALDWEIVKNKFHFASTNNVVEVSKLISTTTGYDIINEADNDGRTMLHWAVDREATAVVKLLLEAGAAVDVRDNDGMTPLAYAVSCEHESLVKLLLSHDADSSIADNIGDDPYSMANGAIKAILKSHNVV